MTKCKSCGKYHDLVLENRETGEAIPVDWCKECFFSKGYTHKEPEWIWLYPEEFVDSKLVCEKDEECN